MTDFSRPGQLLDTKMHVISLKLMLNASTRAAILIGCRMIITRDERPPLDPRRINHLSLLTRARAIPQRFPGIHLLRINQCVKLITAGRSLVTRLGQQGTLVRGKREPILLHRGSNFGKSRFRVV